MRFNAETQFDADVQPVEGMQITMLVEHLYNMGVDPAILADDLAIEKIPDTSKTAQQLRRYYKLNSNDYKSLANHIRDGVHDDINQCTYMGHGAGYDWVDEDVLGGNGDGNTHKQFNKQWEQQETKKHSLNR